MSDDARTFEERLHALRAGAHGSFTPEQNALLVRGRERVALLADEVARRAPGPGDRAPDFELPDALGRPVSLATLLERGPAVVQFYRGGW